MVYTHSILKGTKHSFISFIAIMLTWRRRKISWFEWIIKNGVKLFHLLFGTKLLTSLHAPCYDFILFSISNPFFLVLFQLRAVDEMNYDFQALALESRGMGEVRGILILALSLLFNVHQSRRQLDNKHIAFVFWSLDSCRPMTISMKIHQANLQRFFND